MVQRKFVTNWENSEFSKNSKNDVRALFRETECESVWTALSEQFNAKSKIQSGHFDDNCKST